MSLNVSVLLFGVHHFVFKIINKEKMKVRERGFWYSGLTGLGLEVVGL